MITANWMVKFYAPIAWTITQQSVTSAVQESGAKMLKVMITPVFADNATTTLAVKNAIHSFTMMMLMSMMTAIFATSAIRESEKNAAIHEYGYKPESIFYGDSNRYFGVELEIDGAGKDDDYATEILDIANMRDDHIYIKTDGSLDDGMEIVTHPMSLEYHKDFCWEDIMHHAVRLGYRSHQTSTCGLHIHVNRDSLGLDRDTQDEVISRILYFVEHHWNEMLKFSRRSEYAMNRWTARYGYENSPKAIMDKAKKNYGRYVAVNLCNYHTIEFRLFRVTLKYNTLIATLELVNRICELAVLMDDDEIAKLSWSEFVAGITESEIIQYLKERSLYINEKIEETEEF